MTKFSLRSSIRLSEQPLFLDRQISLMLLSVVPLAQPPAGVFPTRENLSDAAKAWAASRGMQFVTLRSDDNRINA